MQIRPCTLVLIGLCKLFTHNTILEISPIANSQEMYLLFSMQCPLFSCFGDQRFDIKGLVSTNPNDIANYYVDTVM